MCGGKGLSQIMTNTNYPSTPSNTFCFGAIFTSDDPVSSGAQTNPTVYLKIQIVDINIDLRERHRALGHNSSSPLNQPPISCMVGEQWSKYTIGMVDWLGHSMQLSIPRWLSKNLPDQPSIGNPGQYWLVHHMPPF